MHVGGIMYNQKSLLAIYNSQSNIKINQQELSSILPNLYMIINRLNCSDKDIVLLINCLMAIKKQGAYDKITIELIDFIIKVMNNGGIQRDFFYFPAFLMIIILPYNTYCVEENIVAALTNIRFFVTLVINGLMTKKLTEKDLNTIGIYNKELENIIKVAIKVEKIYKRHVINDQILRYIILHMEALLYMRLEDYDFDYNILLFFIGNIVNNPDIYQNLIALCVQKGITKDSIMFAMEALGDDLSSNYVLIEAKVYKLANEILQRFYERSKEKEKSGEENEGQYSSY